MLDLSISTFLITLLNIAILFFVLRKILFKRVTKFMSARTERIQTSIQGADKDRQQAKELLSQYEAKLKNANAEAEDIIKTAKRAAKEEAARIISEGQKSAEALIAEGHKRIEAEREIAFASFRAEAAALVINASSAILKRELTKEDNLQFASLLLKEVRRQ